MFSVLVIGSRISCLGEGRRRDYCVLTVPSTYVGKHPVCVLQEVCVKKHWGVPKYKLVHYAGSARIFQVRVTQARMFVHACVLSACVCVCMDI